MKEQINRYARGVFEYEPLLAEVFPPAVSGVVWKNQVFTGTLRIKERFNREIKGLIYSTNNRIHIVNTQFVGTDSTIGYTVDTTGIEAGDRLTGFFRIVTNGGEEQIPFEFGIEAGAYESELGDVKNLFHFANLAQTNPAEAVKLFTMPEFSSVFLKDDLSMSKLHDQLLLGSDIKTALEEFLIAIHKKTRVNISLDHTELKLSDIAEDIRETIVISKDVWGRIELKIDADGDFIELDKDCLTEEDFIGGKFEYVFFVKKDKLHAGKNMGCIRFSTPYEEKKFVIYADNSVDEERRQRSLTEKRNIVKLMNAYMSFRLHKKGISWWSAESREALGELLAIDEENPYYCLVMAQILIADKKTNEAKFYLESAKDGAVAARESMPVLYCYYLYVNTIYNRDRTYAKETAQTVKNIYDSVHDGGERDKQKKDWRILWILLYLDVEMSKNKSLKLLRIKEQYKGGMRSPMLYLEACIILNEQPMLLRVLNDFEINTLLFGCKQGIIETRLLRQAAELAVRADGRMGLLYRLLKALYAESQDKEVLEAVCSILTRCEMTGKKYLTWYELGIEKGLRITRLYEHYIASRDFTDTSPLPKMVLLYFTYTNELDYRRKAYLYANLIRYRNDNPQIYKNYARQMEDFVREELANGRADENAGIVFAEYLNKDMIGKENALTAAEALFTCKVTCGNPNMRNVVVGHKETDILKKYPVNDGTAYVQIYTDEPCICFEDGRGRWYKDSVEYKVEPVFNDASVRKSLYPYCEEKLYLALHFCEKQNRYRDNSLDTIRLYNRTANVRGIRPEYRQYLMSQVIDYYFDSYEGDDMSELLDSIVVEELNEEYLAKLSEALLIHGRYSEAYNIAGMVREERLNPKRMLRLCDHILEEAENSEKLFVPEDRFVSLVYYAFSKGKYNDRTLKLLNMYYNGATKDMIELWNASVENGIDTYELEERILCQMLFTGHYSKKTSEVFGHYYNNGAKERIVEAYLAYHSYNYFVKEAVVPSGVFEIIEARLEAEKDVIPVCRMALLKFYSECSRLDMSQIDLAKSLMEGLTRKGYIFSFYEKFTEYFTLPYEVADKTIIEYRTNPSRRVVIHYALEGGRRTQAKKSAGSEDFVAMDMKNVYEGIFVKIFVMFYGENIQYYITEEDGAGETATESRRVENRAVGARRPEGRYEMINEMLACRQLHDSKSLDRQLHIYGVNSVIVEQLFKPLD